MDKKVATISFRATPELERALKAVAEARDLTVSDLCYQAMLNLASDEQRRYFLLKQSFDSLPDLQGLRDA
jgi:uncharacterized protein (DUF1778 family)